MPLSTDMSGGLVNLTSRFADWTEGLEKRKGFQQFVAYVRENGPLFVKALVDAGRAVGDIIVAIAPLGGPLLKGISGFAQAVSSFAESNPKVVQAGVAYFGLSAGIAAAAGPAAKLIAPLRGVSKGIGKGVSATRTSIRVGRDFVGGLRDQRKALKSGASWATTFGSAVRQGASNTARSARSLLSYTGAQAKAGASMTKTTLAAGRQRAVLAVRAGAQWAKDLGRAALAQGRVALATGKTTLLVARQKAGMLIAAAASKVAAVASKAFAFATRLVTLALAANPIGIIVVGLVALGVALVVAYKKSDRFRAIVNGTWSLIKRGFSFMWERVLRPGFSAIRGWLGDRLPAVFRVLRTVGGVVFKAIGGYVRTWWKVFSTIFRAARRVVRALGDAFGTAKSAIKKAWSGLGDFLSKPLNAAISVFRTLIGFYNKIARKVGLPQIKIGDRKQKGSYSRKHPTQGGRGHVVRPGGGVGGKGGKRERNKGAERVWPANTRTLSGNYPGHSGVDIAAAMGTPIKAASSGVIDYVGWNRGYGQAIFERFANGLQAVYGHTSKTFVKAGQRVRAGQQIGLIGSTGRSTGPHLHFEINAAGPFGYAPNRNATLSWLGGAKFSGRGGSASSGLASLNPLNIFKGSLDALKEFRTSPMGGMLFKLASGIPGAVARNIFDRGGVASTAGVMLKPTIRPERVLSPQQTKDFHEMVRHNFGNAAADQLTAAEVRRATRDGVLDAFSGGGIQIVDRRTGLRLQTKGAR